MKFDATVFSVATNGDKLTIIMDAVGDGDAEWRRTNRISLECSDTERARRAMHVGRNVRIEVTVRR